MSKLIIKNRFATTPNELLYNPEISLRAKGLYGYIQAKPDGWNFSADRIATESKEGLHAVRMALKELETHGYLQRIKGQDDKGFWTIDYVLHSTPIKPTSENPTCENPTCENPMSENPTSENPTSENCANNINKDYTKQLFKNKEEEKEEENKFDYLRQSEFFIKLTDYFSQNNEPLKMKVFSFLVARINKGEFEEFQKQTLAYMEYKSLSKETIHRWLGYSAEWREENWIDKLSKIKTKPKSTIKKTLI